MTQLPNGCYVSDFKVSPKDWDKPGAKTDANWIIHYTFFDPEFAAGKRRQVKGMNFTKDVSLRRALTKEAIADELQKLLQGYNPFKKAIIASVNGTFNITPDTPFVTALWAAFEKVKAVAGTLLDIKSVIRGVDKSAKQLGFDKLPVKSVSRKYFKLLFEQCYKNNIHFTAKRQNKYRAYLIRLYKELIEMEVVEINPLRDISKERESKNERVLPSLAERIAISEFLKKDYYTFWRGVQIFFASGAREIELFRVQKKHVDLKNQRCLYTVKKGIETREIWRPIVDATLPLWKELIAGCMTEDYFLFSKNLTPGVIKISSSQFGRRWQRHIKKKLNIDVDLYTLKHINTTELMEKLDNEYNPAEDVRKLTGHTTTAMIVNIYDTQHKERRDNKIKKAGNPF